MIRREDFIDALGMPDEGFTNAVDAALRQVKEGEARPVMKRKMTLTMLAAVLAVIALTGAALAVGLNLFDHFGRNDRRLQVVAPEVPSRITILPFPPRTSTIFCAPRDAFS